MTVMVNEISDIHSFYTDYFYYNRNKINAFCKHEKPPSDFFPSTV